VVRLRSESPKLSHVSSRRSWPMRPEAHSAAPPSESGPSSIRAIPSSVGSPASCFIETPGGGSERPSPTSTRGQVAAGTTWTRTELELSFRPPRHRLGDASGHLSVAAPQSRVRVSSVGLAEGRNGETWQTPVSRSNRRNNRGGSGPRGRQSVRAEAHVSPLPSSRAQRSMPLRWP
jgi:hypothetical protein